MKRKASPQHVSAQEPHGAARTWLFKTLQSLRSFSHQNIHRSISQRVKASSDRNAAIPSWAIIAIVAMIAAGFGLQLAYATSGGSGSISLTTLGVAYTQNFDTLTNTPDAALSNVLPNGWLLEESGTSARNDGRYAVGTGSSNTGDIYGYGTPIGNSDRALGTLRSGTLVPIIGASFTNNTGSAITELVVSYTGEQWRLGTSNRIALPTVEKIDFQISTDATSLTTGTYTDVNSLDFTSPIAVGTVGLLNGNLAANRTAINTTITGLNIADGATFFIRWTDFDVSGADDGLAVEDFSLTPKVGDAAPMVSSTVPINGATNVALNANVTVNFSEAVNVSGAWFTIVGSVSGPHTATVSGGPTSFTLDPDTDFVNIESVTVTILAAQVTDQDADDPPDQMAANFQFSFATPIVVICGNPATFVHDVQGNGLTSPINGATNVEIEGIVVGDYQGAGQFSGFFVQEEDSDVDADPATSEGIFVFNTSFAVNAGDKVRVRGNVFEFLTSGVFLTELTSVSAVSICSSGNTVTPTTVTLPVAAITDLERYEGMLISNSQELTVTDNFTLGRFGEVGLSVGGRLLNPTNITTPGAAAIAQQDLNDRSRIVLDDANNQQNIDPTLYPAPGLSALNTLRVGYKTSGLTGVLEQRFGLYRVQPVGPISFSADNPRTPAPDSVGGTLKVASFNVLNYFNGNGMGGGFPTPRGANNAVEFTRQRDKIISAITTINADIAGLIEIENDATPNSAIEDLVSGLNAAAGPGSYSFIDTGVVGTDEIRVAIIYKPATVAPVGSFSILNSSVDPLFIDTLNRPALAQTFSQALTDAKFTLVVNHLKSKGSACPGDPDTGDGQGNCNVTRTNAATALVNWLATDPTGSGDPDFLIIGDLNAYAKEDPITVFNNAGYAELIQSFVGADAYSFQFDGQSGYLDHALASPSLAAQVAGAAEWHINADEPVVLDYNLEFKTVNQHTTFYDPGPYRASDHDPLVVGLALPHDFTGFFQPVDNFPTLNLVKAGANVPVKFSLGGDKGLDIFAPGYPKSEAIACDSTAELDGIEETVTAGSSSLSFDPATNVYTYVWKTEKAWANTCRQLVVKLNDTTIHRANFKFK
jgi:uncharacterized protein